MATRNWNDIAKTLLDAGTLTTSQPAGFEQTWNDGGVTFTGFRVNVTDTASAAASLLADLQVGGVSQFKVSKAGLVTATQYDAGAAGYGFKFVSGVGVSALYGNSEAVGFETAGVRVLSNGGVQWSASASALNGGIDLVLRRDAANTLAQRNGVNAQEQRWYATYASATDYHRQVRKSAKATLSNVSGATVTATGLIPAGAVLKGISTKVTTGLGTTNSTTGYAVGTVADPNLWGNIVGTAAGTSSAGVDATADPAGVWSASARDVILTAAGGNFDATGVIEVYAHYDIVEAD